jgi:hypothetical protein
MSDDEFTERMSRRFETDHDESQNNMSSSNATHDKKAQNSQKAQNIKKEWNVRSFYLSDDLDDDLTTAFKRLDLELSEAGADLNLKKTRHFYPMIVELGLEQLESMESTEVTERLESRE